MSADTALRALLFRTNNTGYQLWRFIRRARKGTTNVIKQPSIIVDLSISLREIFCILIHTQISPIWWEDLWVYDVNRTPEQYQKLHRGHHHLLQHSCTCTDILTHIKTQTVTCRRVENELENPTELGPDCEDDKEYWHLSWSTKMSSSN